MMLIKSKRVIITGIFTAAGRPRSYGRYRAEEAKPPMI